MPSDFTTEALKQEIDLDPESIGYKQTFIIIPDPIGQPDVTEEVTLRKDTATILQLLNTPSSDYVIRPNLGKTSVDLILQVLAPTGALTKVLDLANSTNPVFSSLTPDLIHKIRSASTAFNIWLSNPINNFDLDSLPVRQCMEAFKLVGALTEEEVTNVLSLADKHISRAEYLWGSKVTEDQVERSK